MLLLSLSVFFEAVVVLHGSRDCHPPILNFIAKKRQIITGFRGDRMREYKVVRMQSWKKKIYTTYYIYTGKELLHSSNKELHFITTDRNNEGRNYEILGRVDSCCTRSNDGVPS
jgi:hypothetical protein